jgi:hypothetical protein
MLIVVNQLPTSYVDSSYMEIGYSQLKFGNFIV